MSKYIAIAKTSEIQPGQIKYVEIEDYRLALCNLNGTFYCFENTCTHDGGPLNQGELMGDVVECPRHGGRFNVTTGKAVRMPAVAPIEVYPLIVEGDEIKVDLE
ncbi:MAG TPA: non-heme iron oxygenase ferredoxin subunit [Chloroflexota bacterium]|nr:non-heme iron oxygenase ferredoxin subunit [Chloroflexota bacterium]